MISFEFNESLAEEYGGPMPTGFTKRAFEFSQLREALGIQSRRSVRAMCAVVFSDISGFSNMVAGMNPSDIKEFLDEYYGSIIPIIHRYGGLIDQMFGDGIISVFTNALSAKVPLHPFTAADSAAKKIVARFAGDRRFSTKCSLHVDQALICEVGAGEYKQATIVGNLMTVVHRLEGVAESESVNMLESLRQVQIQKDVLNVVKQLYPWKFSGNGPGWLWNRKSHVLRGVSPLPVTVLYKKYFRD